MNSPRKTKAKTKPAQPVLLGPVTSRAVRLARKAAEVVREHDELKAAAVKAGVSDPHVEKDCAADLREAAHSLWALAIWYAQLESHPR